MPARRRLLLAAGLVAITVAAYLPAFRAGFVWDDDSHVTGNRWLRDVEGLARLWAGPAPAAPYYPLTFTVFWVEYQLWGDWAGGYHAVNVALHAASAVLLWRLLWRLRVPGALLAAAVFAVHPVHVESVTWVAELKNVLSGLFYLLAAGWFLRFALGEGAGPANSRPRWRLYALSLAAFACALASKTATCTLPAALLCVLWWKRQRLTWRDAALVAPMFVLAAAAAAVTIHVELSSSIGASGLSLGVWRRCAIAGAAIWFYVGKLLWPHPLVPIYPRWEIAGWWPALLAAAVAVGVALRLLRRRVGKGPAAAWAIYLIGLSPTLGFVNQSFMLQSWVADHYQYLPSVALIAGFCAAAAVGARRLGPRARPAGWALAGAVVVALSAKSWVQSGIYQGRETFFSHISAHNPQSHVAELWAGTVAAGKGDLEAALRHFRRAAETRPDSPHAHSNLGKVLGERGQIEEACAHLREAIRLQPADAWSHWQLGLLLGRTGDWRGAAEQHMRAVQCDPELAGAWNALAIALLRTGDAPKALAAARQATRLGPNVADYRVNLAQALTATGQPGEAAREYQAALELDPDSADAHFDLAVLALRARREAEAIASFRKAMRCRPDWPMAASNLALLLATARDPSLREPAEAVALARRAVERTNETDPKSLSALAAAYASAGDFPRAVGAARQAIDVARAAGNEKLAEALAGHLATYEAGRPLVEAAPTRPTAGPPASAPLP